MLRVSWVGIERIGQMNYVIDEGAHIFSTFRSQLATICPNKQLGNILGLAFHDFFFNFEYRS